MSAYKLSKYLFLVLCLSLWIFPVQSFASIPATPGGIIPSFKDIQGHWAQMSIERLTAQHLLKGVSPTRFEPNRLVTYEEWYALLDRINQYQPISSEPHEFTIVGVPTSHWAYPSVNRLANIGVLYGVQPGKAIPREEVAETTARFLALDQVRQSYMDAPVSRFLDVVKDPHETYQQTYTAIQAVNDYGLMQGFPNGKFQPHAPLTRAQAAVILERIREQHRQMLKTASTDTLLKERITDRLSTIVHTAQEAHGKISFFQLQTKLSAYASENFLETMVKWYHEMNLEGTDASIMIPSGQIARSGKGIYIVTPLHTSDHAPLYKVFIRENWGALHGFVSMECYVREEGSGLKIVTQKDVYQELVN